MHEPVDKIVFKVYQSTSHQSLQNRGRRQWAKPLGSAAPPVGSEACKTRFIFFNHHLLELAYIRIPFPTGPPTAAGPWGELLRKSSKFQTPTNAFFVGNGALLGAHGHQQITQSCKNASQDCIFYPIRKTSQTSSISGSSRAFSIELAST